MSSADHDKVVVGVDGSASSQAALQWALWHARLTRGVIIAVMSWEFPELYDWPMPSASEVTRHTAEKLDEAINAVADHEQTIPVDQRVAQGHPTKALLRTVSEENANLLVVGNRGHGGFTEALLGSIGQYCISYATCPVVVVRTSRSGSE